MKNESRDRAIAWITRELDMLRRAPALNGCEMKPEWAEQIEVWETALEVLKGHHPAHIDREAWSGCDFCQKELDDYPYIAAHGDFSGSDTCYEPSYCPVCGRPLKEEAWAELENRLMG